MGITHMNKLSLLALVTPALTLFAHGQGSASNMPIAAFISTSIVAPAGDEDQIIQAWWTKTGLSAADRLDKDKVLTHLARTRSSLAYVSRAQDGTISYLVGSITASNTAVSGVYGWYQYDTFTYAGKNYYIGISTEIISNFRLTRGSLDTGSLFNLGLKGSASDLNGTIETNITGIVGKPVADAIFVPTTVTQDSVIDSITKLAVVKSKIFDNGVTITPRIIAIPPETSSRTLIAK